ncbi:HepT-like ribonuclease domain-containing protein [Maribacter cobaltidurans]|uniref:Uncharacterized protein n=1 Tax=Maribacter cobaltidurans TaxID=1178778 RepID=A0A223V105_9FLAO|nr:DUF86 domain-containing protein [Maribacter cobaltidurans]ASV29006.1 hypothetical protein CJ263_01480 [Maribacter cobaltidurans]GGD72768.1 DUF86 domain-containing protein [Maribacter cobaltidurans]
MSKRDNDLLLMDMLDAAEKILKYTSNLDYSTFLENEMVIDAVARNFEIIGEAANRVNPDFKIIHPQIEWLRIIGFRNRIIHEYFGIDYEIMWTIIEENIVELIDELNQLIN